jgi:quinol monooxygenase YgiN
MVVEYIRYRVDRAEEFLDAYEKACESLRAAPECQAYELTRCSEDPACFVLRIVWSSAEAHLQGFRKGPHFPAFLVQIRSFMPAIEEMRHYEHTSLHWQRA